MNRERQRGCSFGALFLYPPLLIALLTIGMPGWAYQEAGSTAASPGLHFLELFSDGRHIVLGDDLDQRGVENSVYAAREGVPGVPWWSRLEPWGERRHSSDNQVSTWCALPLEIEQRTVELRFLLEETDDWDVPAISRVTLYRLSDGGSPEAIPAEEEEDTGGMSYHFDSSEPGRYLLTARLESLPSGGARLSVLAKPMMNRAD